MINNKHSPMKKLSGCRVLWLSSFDSAQDKGYQVEAQGTGHRAMNSPSPVWSREQGVRYSKRAKGKEFRAQGKKSCRVACAERSRSIGLSGCSKWFKISYRGGAETRRVFIHEFDFVDLRFSNLHE
jgi:hypothetical protein